MDETGKELNVPAENLKRSGSLDELRIPDAETATFKEKSGLLRRVFTGSRRKKGKKVPSLHQLSPVGQLDSSFVPPLSRYVVQVLRSLVGLNDTEFT